MFRKVCMVLIDVVLAPSGVAIQSLITLMLLASMFIATLVLKPFGNPTLQKLELASLMTSFLTLWLGSFFWASENNNVIIQICISILIVVLNVLFIVRLIWILLRDGCKDYELEEKIGER